MSQGPAAPAFGAFSGLVDSSVVTNIHAGSPVYPSATGTLLKASASAAATAKVAGLAMRSGTGGEILSVISEGPLVLEESQWNLILPSESTGLIPGAIYYVDTGGGRLVQAPPPSSSGDVDEAVGIALNSTTMLVNLTGTLTFHG